MMIQDAALVKVSAPHTDALRFRKESVNDFIYSFQGWRTARAR